jgi:hypothetical protein
MYAKEIGTPLEVFRGRAHKTADGHLQKDFQLSESGRAVLRGGRPASAAPSRPLPPSFAVFAEAKKQYLEKQGVKPGDPFEKFVIKRGTPEHEEVMKLVKKSSAKK